MKDKFIIIDLFAGIGWFRLALENINSKWMFSIDIDEHACKMYEANFGNNPYCDITTINLKRIPNFDILCTEFHYQAFSIWGKKKGFIDDTRGILFFNIVEYFKKKSQKNLYLKM